MTQVVDNRPRCARNSAGRGQLRGLSLRRGLYNRIVSNHTETPESTATNRCGHHLRKERFTILFPLHAPLGLLSKRRYIRQHLR